MSKSIAYKHYLRALSRWPKDPLRPETQFQDAIRRRIDRQFLPTSSSDATTPPQKLPYSPVDEKAELEKAELENVNVLYSLLENRYSRKYPISGNLMKPTSNPTYYTDLMQELAAAPTRSWLESTVQRWKGFFQIK